MNFLNFLTSKADLFNFNLLSQASNFQRENTILVEPSKQIQSPITELEKQKLPKCVDAKEENAKGTNGEVLAGEISQLLSQEQMLINQYMELKLKYLATCLNLPQTVSEEIKVTPTTDSNNEKMKSNSEEQMVLRKKIKKKNKCGHDDKIHYAKGMCNNCYHKYGRTKKPWNCTHDKLYAAGMCQNCYINNYNRKRRQDKQVGDKEDHELSMSENEEQLEQKLQC